MDESKTVIVTGAGSGVGRCAAMCLAEADCAVVLVGRTESKLQATARLLAQQTAGRAAMLLIPANVADPEAALQVVEQTLEQFGRIDALANVAGFAPRQPIGQITASILRQSINTNLVAPVLMTTAVWTTFAAQQAGVIVNVSSIASVEPFPGFNIYASAKAGLNMFTRCTAEEGTSFGIKAVVIAPGAIETPMLRRLFDTRAIPKDRTLDPATVAGVICDCITGVRAFTSGEMITLASP